MYLKSTVVGLPRLTYVEFGGDSTDLYAWQLPNLLLLLLSALEMLIHLIAQAVITTLERHLCSLAAVDAAGDKS